MCPLTESHIAIVVSPKGPNNPLCMLGLFGCNAEHSTSIENSNPIGSTKENIQEEKLITYDPLVHIYVRFSLKNL